MHSSSDIILLLLVLFNVLYIVGHFLLLYDRCAPLEKFGKRQQNNHNNNEQKV